MVDTPVDAGLFEDIALGLAPVRRLPGLDDVAAAAGRLRSALRDPEAQNRDDIRRWCPTVRADVRNNWVTDAEGKSFRVLVSPGTIALGSLDTNKAEKSVQRAIDAKFSDGDLAASIISEAVAIGPGISDSMMETNSKGYGKVWVDYETGELGVRDAAARSEVTEWSKRSRMRMVRALAELDYSQWDDSAGDSAMVTLTYPGDWESVAPDGRTVKNHFRRLQHRWRRALGKDSWRVLWKLEFQKRGAPHIHFLARVPATVGKVSFEEWLSNAWAAAVGASTEIDRCNVATRKESSEFSRHVAGGTGVDFGGMKVSDPRRIALYFLGHSMKSTDGKEYQHIVPELWQAPGKGPGRFWGHAGFDKAVVALDLDIADFYRLARELRKLRRARDWKMQLIRRRGIAAQFGSEVSAVTHRWSQFTKKTRSLGGGGSVLGGWVLLNNAVAVVDQYSSWLAGPSTTR